MPWAAIQDKSALETNSGTIVAAQKDRRAALADQARRHLDHPRRTDATVYVDRQTLLGELVGDGQALEPLAVGAAVEHELVGSYLVRPHRRLWMRLARSHTLPRPLARRLQTRCRPQPVSSPWAHRVSSRLRKMPMRLSQSEDIVPPAPSTARSPAHPASPSAFDRPTPIGPPKNSVQARAETPPPRLYATCRRRAGTLTSNGIAHLGSHNIPS
jgi:hypothetical protein